MTTIGLVTQVIKQASDDDLDLLERLLGAEKLLRSHTPSPEPAAAWKPTLSSSTVTVVRALPPAIYEAPKPQKPQVDADGYCRVSVCKGACDPKWCYYEYEYAKYGNTWKPRFNGRHSDGRHIKAVTGSQLIVRYLNKDIDFEDTYDALVKYGGEVDIRDGNTFAFVACKTHAEAVDVRKRLVTEGGYTVEFVCSNLPKKYYK